jgi:alpha-amylase
MNKTVKRSLSVILFFALLTQPFVFSFESANISSVLSTQVADAADNSLPAATKDGVILHAWNWSFNTIRSRLPEIAAAGFKTIQTSPIQGNKENTMVGSNWWILYQPINFNIGNTQLGTREQFRQLCAEAENYGINIIVDVVANHTGNAGLDASVQYVPAYNVDASIRNNPYFWHELRGITNWNDRWQVTQLGIGLPDLNTSNQELQDKMIAFLNDAISLGADGFRFDAAKHIELPTDQYGASNFWTRVLDSLNNRSNLYIYGEVLQGGADAFAQYANYMNVTASYYGESVRHAVGFNNAKNVNLAYNYNAANVAPSKLVTWVESHDTYANLGDESTNMSEWQIKMGWAIITARAQTVPLFFNRPAGTGKFAATLGTAGNNLWKDPDVAAVNKFHNAMAGQSEYLRYQGNEIILIERGNKGMVIANLGGNAAINQPTNLANGVYTNKATGGGTFTVANGRITGNIAGGTMAVLYNDSTSTQSVNVAFTVRNATTVMGQNVYLVGNIPGLGNWNVSQAFGPGSTANYPHWGFTVNLPVGTTFEYKAIKRDAANNVVWESGANRTYTVSASNNQVSFDFRN